MKTILALLALLCTLNSHADDKLFKQNGQYKIFYSAFNSTFIDPDVAVVNQIVRGKDKGLVNIAVVRNPGTGLPAVITGDVYNIFQMRTPLKFVEIREQDTIYYLSAFDFENEDLLTFKISVQPQQDQPAYALKFQKKMYHD